MIKKKSPKTPVLAVVVSALFFAVALPAAQAEEAATKGTFVPSKGTRSEQDHQGLAGRLYEFGRGFQLGALNLKPFIEYIAQWESNVFFDETDEKDDFIHRLGTGLTGELPFAGGQHVLSGGYLAEMEWFNRYDSQDHTDHSVRSELDLNFVPFSVNARDTYRTTVSRADTEFTERTKRDENAFNVLLEIPFTRFFLESELNDFDVDYDSSANSIFDSNVLSLYQRAGFDVAPSTQLLAEYGHLFIDYDQPVGERDGEADQVSLGLRGVWGERITYQVWPGVQWRSYDEDGRPDFDGFILRSALQYDIAEKSHIVLRGSRNPVESTFDGQSFYVQNRGEIEWRQQIAERIYFQTREVLTYNDYSRTTLRAGENKTREDIILNGDLRLEYFMPNDFILLFLEYAYVNRDSNLSGLDYENNTVSAGIRGNF